ncbi:MAG: PIN domain-containing protein [Candidatus Dormiibacterota bacterium]
MRARSLDLYDASYLALAQREGLALATRDTRLGAAAETAGFERLAGRDGT